MDAAISQTHCKFELHLSRASRTISWTLNDRHWDIVPQTRANPLLKVKTICTSVRISHSNAFLLAGGVSPAFPEISEHSLNSILALSRIVFARGHADEGVRHTSS